MKIITVVLMCCLTLTRCSKVLINPFGIYKNTAQGMLEKLAIFLANNHYDVHLLVYEGYQNTLTEGVTLVRYQRPGHVNFTVNQTYSVEEYMETSVYDMTMRIYKATVVKCESILQATVLMDFLQDEQYDLFVYDAMEVCSPILGNFLNIPTIGFVQFLVQLKLRQLENPSSVSYFPFTTLLSPKTFYERTVNFLSATFAHTWSHVYLTSVERTLGEYYNMSVRPLDSLYFHLGGHPLQVVAPVLSDMVYTNDFFISKATNQPFSDNIEQFINSSGEHGIIIFTFGSKMSNFGRKYSEMFAEALSALPQKVLWRHTGPLPRNLPENVKLFSWLPQPNILAHPKTKLFITHGGINSMYEAIYYGVPLVVCPLNFDQFYNAAKISDMLNVGKQIDLKTATSTTIRSVITEVLDNRTYKKNVRQLSTLFRDKPVPSQELVLYWVDYVIRHKGIKHLRPYGRQLPWFQYYNLDVFVFMTLVVMVAVSVLYNCCYSTKTGYVKLMHERVSLKAKLS